METHTKMHLTYDDVLLVPQHSDIESRSQINIGSYLDKKRDLWFDIPVISAPMDTVTGSEMAIELGLLGMLAIVHRYNSVDAQYGMASYIFDHLNDNRKTGFAIGITGDYLERAEALVKGGARILCLDVAHGDHSMMQNAIHRLREVLGDEVHLMAGNVATREGASRLAAWGADSVRVGIGGGSICSTRIQTGHGVPSLASVLACKGLQNVTIIADGGIRNPGDIVKALAAGAGFGMVGSLLAGTDKTPGEVIVGHDGTARKIYRGMASRDAQMDWRGRAASLEGVSTTVPYKGTTRDAVEQIRNGIASGFSYTGARTLTEFTARAQFIQQSLAGIRESDTHILHR
jgi:IMP dehydrogenase